MLCFALSTFMVSLNLQFYSSSINIVYYHRLHQSFFHESYDSLARFFGNLYLLSMKQTIIETVILEIYLKHLIIFILGGVDTASENGIFDISNSDRLGRSEVELMQVVVDGITLLVKMEKLLEKGKSIESLIPEGTRFPDEPMGSQVFHLHHLPSPLFLLCDYKIFIIIVYANYALIKYTSNNHILIPSLIVSFI